ncbi:MAG: hypothetical protein GY940_02155, partial [bacterium]|nr:hypothetical protein [bacterium]
MVRIRVRQLKKGESDLERLVDQRTRQLKTANEIARQERRIAEKANRSKSEFLADMSHEIQHKKIIGHVLRILRHRRRRLFNIIILTILTAMAIPGNLFAQKNNIRFRHLSLEQDLSQVIVHSIVQDGQGFMWFGTEDGLNKYDGYKFTVYRHNPDDRASLGQNWILSIIEDSGGNLWIGTQGGGLNKFDKKTGTFTRFRNRSDNPSSISHNRVNSIIEDSGGYLWIGTGGGGLNKFDKKTGTFTRFLNQANNPRSLGHNFVNSIIEDSAGNLWIGTGGGGLNKFDKKTGTFTRFLNQANNPRS